MPREIDVEPDFLSKIGKLRELRSHAKTINNNT